MSRRSGSRRLAAAAPVWGPRKLLTVALAIAFVLLTLLAGIILAVLAALSGGAPASSVRSESTDTTRRGSVSRQDALAAAPMPTADPEAALPGSLSTRAPDALELPRLTGVGPAEVPSGFPPTPRGALAQLAAIDVTAMQTASLEGVRRVIAEWAAPGGPTAQTWSGVRGMTSLLSAAGLSSGGSPQLAIVVRPAMGLIKGTVGPDFAVVCVDLEFTVTIGQTSRIAVADCQRMVWVGERWLIGPGAEPAPAPSIWPGTETARAAGYRELHYV